MSGTRTSPTLDTEDLLGPDLLGDSETGQLDQALNNLAEAVDRDDERVDDLVTEVRQAAEDIGIVFEQLRERLIAAANAAEGEVRNILAAIEEALADASDGDGADDGDDDAIDDGTGDDGAPDDGIGDDDGTDTGTGTGTGDDGDDDAVDGGNGGANGNGDNGSNGDGAAAKTAFALLLPANNSGALGFAAVRLDGNTLDVRFVADNVTPGEQHPLHIHGFADDRDERLAVAGDDTDGDGFVETAEGASAAFGPIIASLTASGAASGTSGEFDVADEAGRIVFSRSYTLESDAADGDDPLSALQSRLEGRIIKLHGLEVAEGAGEGTPGEVNGDGGYATLLPIAAGPLLFLPDEVAAQFADRPEALLDGITAFLDALAPFTLKADGSGAIASDPFLSDEAGLAGARDTGDNGDNDNGANDNGANGNGANGSGADGDANGAVRFVSLILPANNSGVFGAVSITFDEDAGTVAVEMNLAGLEPGRAHAMHIHGFADDRASLIPNITLDADLDGFVESSEGASVVGPVLFGLTDDGSITDASLIGAWPEADANGFLSLRQTYTFDLDDPAESALFGELEDRMEGRLIQVHGLTVDAAQGEDTRGEVAGEAGFQPLLPIAHGAILSTETEGGAFAAQFVDLLQAALEAQASSGDTTPMMTTSLQDAVFA